MSEKARKLKTKIIESIKKNKTALLIAAAIIVVAVVIDQVTKAAFDNMLVVTKSVGEDGKTGIVTQTTQFIGNWLRFSFTLNYGASFGSMEGQNGLFFVVTLIGLPLFAAFMWMTLKDSKLGAYGIALIIGGVIGNMIDRAFCYTVDGGFFSGAVRDFISVDTLIIPMDYICNFADVCISVGVAIYLLGVLFIGQNAFFKKKGQKAEDPQSKENEG